MIIANLDKVPVKITWEYNGGIGEYIDDFGFCWLEDGYLHDYWWTEGNGSCDDNRSRMFGLADKYPELCVEEDRKCFPCGHTIKILSIQQLPLSYLKSVDTP